MTLEELKAENARLKAELAYDKRVQLHVDKLAAEFTQSEVERLKAEVERLISVSEAWKKRRLDKVEAECIKWSDYEKLKAEVERLRKAGDWMFNALILNSDKDIGEGMNAWNAAKEGKQS